MPLIRALAAALLLLLPLSVAAQAAPMLPEPVARALAQAGIPETAIGVYVHEIGAGQPLVAVGADRALNPASSMKLVTTYAGLELLGPAYRWNTEILTDGTLAQDALTGNLYLKGSGDPKITLENFWLLLTEIMGQPELGRDPRYGSNEARTARKGEVVALVSEWSARRSKAEIQSLLGGRVPFGPVNTVADMNGASGLLSEIAGGRLSVRLGNLVVALIAIAVTWSANIYEIIAYASQAFVAYYALQAAQAAVTARRRRQYAHAALYGAAVAVALAIVFFASPVSV